MFKVLGKITKKSPMPSSEEIKKVSSFMLTRYLSGNRNCLKLANLFNNYSKIPLEYQYKASKIAFQDHPNVNFIKFPKKIPKDDSKRIEVISEILNLSKDKSKDYLLYLAEDEYQEIEAFYNLKHSR